MDLVLGNQTRYLNGIYDVYILYKIKELTCTAEKKHHTYFTLCTVCIIYKYLFDF